ncbi:MAG: thiamine phosphate synthase [Akkermansia sp.]|nr:thiamine phosphate synthase [Akkermansia sp.]
MRRSINYHLYLVTDESEKCRHGLLETVRRAVRGGVTVVQYRTVNKDYATQLAEVKPLQAFLKEAGVPLIINNNVELAIEIGADGLHVGQGDTPVEEARRRIGPDMILGLSVSDAEQMAAVNTELVDYVGCGPVFPTNTKTDAAKDVGLEGWNQLAAACPLPVVAIGGLNKERTAAVRATGLAAGVAIVSYICAAEYPEQAAADLL